MTTRQEEVAVQEELVYPRAVEAAIWGMPLVSMGAFRRSLPRDLGAEFGDVVYMSDVMRSRHGFLTANNQTPYVAIVLDLRKGPMVLEVPAASDKVALFGSAIDSWQVPLVDVGPTGDDAGEGGRYLFTPPDRDEAMPEGFFVVPSPTTFVHVGLRPITRSAGTLADAVAYSQGVKAYPLAAAADPPESRYIDAFPKTWDTLPRFDLDFFRLLAEAVEVEPPQEKDAVMIGMLASIGIEQGKPFEPDAERAELLTRAAKTAERYMADYMVNVAFEPQWPGSKWLKLKLDRTYGFSFYGDGKLGYDRRAGGFTYFATWAPKHFGEPGKLPASYYVQSLADHEGGRFDGNGTYRVRFPADTPTRDFWAVIVYAVGTNAFIPTPEDRVGISSYDREALVVNDDGAVDLYVGPQAPEGFEPNWIPTGGKDFWLMVRFYGPEQAVFDGTWALADADKVTT
jgi:hypothetical protein